MGKGEETKQLIIDQALNQAVFLGFESLSIGHLANQLNMSKSGLFAHFKSKEALQISVLDEALHRFNNVVVRPALLKPKGIERISALFDNYILWIRGDENTPGCLFMTLLNEFREKPSQVRDRLISAQDDWHRLIQRLAKEAFGTKTDAQQFCFDLLAISTGFQKWTNLLNKQKGLAHAKQSFKQLIERYNQTS